MKLFFATLRSSPVQAGLLILAGALALSGQSNDSQSIPLQAGWNLVTFQVLPESPAPSAVFDGLGEAFNAAWTYDNAARQWRCFLRPGPGRETNSTVAPLQRLDIGRAYWLHLNTPVPDWVVQGNPPRLTPAVIFTNGWNLVGLPIGAGSLNEPVNMLSVLSAAGMDYDVILRWEQSRYHRFTPNDDGDDDDFTDLDPTKGMWVHAKGGPVALQPRLLSSVRADVNHEPTNRYPSFEDLVLSDSPIPLGPDRQTRIVFLAGEEVQPLAFANSGGGVLMWNITWEPLDAPGAHWLTFSATRGVTTIENDVVLIELNRRDLVKGTYRGRLTLHSTAGDRVFEVVAQVPGLEGEWRGSATISAVDGRSNPIPEIDLHVDFFEDPAVPGLIRGLLDHRNSLLWPVDVPLIGHAQASRGNAFTLGGGFVLPPGDQNSLPYDDFNELDDVDWDCDGKLDAINPYPFPIYRSVRLAGTLVEASPATGYVIKGVYNEVVYGLLRRPIRMQGSFTLRREQAIPFSNRRPAANVESNDGTQPVVLKHFQPGFPLRIPAGRLTNALVFQTDLVLEGIQVEVDLQGAPATNLRLSLQAPDGRAILLHDRDPLASLKAIRFPHHRAPKESFHSLIDAGVASRGAWKLVIENFGSSDAHLFSWSLQLQGQPVFNFTGRIIDETTGAPVPAEILLDGFPVSEALTTAPDGTFTFARLPGIPLNLSASAFGFAPSNPALPGLAPELTTPHFDVMCGSPAKASWQARFRPLPVLPFPAAGTAGFGAAGSLTNPVVLKLRPKDVSGLLQLTAVPPMGTAPLPVRFALSGPMPAGASITWNFGDGTSTNGVGLVAIEHVFREPAAAGYVATAQVGAAAPLPVSVLVLPSPGHSTSPFNFFQPHFTGGGTIPADYFLGITGTNDLGRPAPFAELAMVQHADCASFDLDRFPFTTPLARDYAVDGFPGNFPAHAADYTGNFRGEDYNYRVSVFAWELAGDCAAAIDDNEYHAHPRPGLTGECLAPRYRMVCNVGASILPPSAATVQLPPGDELPPPEAEPWEDHDEFAGARSWKMITGPLAAFWMEGGVR